MHYTYKTKGTCSTEINFDIEEYSKKYCNNFLLLGNCYLMFAT